MTIFDLFTEEEWLDLLTEIPDKDIEDHLLKQIEQHDTNTGSLFPLSKKLTIRLLEKGYPQDKAINRSIVQMAVVACIDLALAKRSKS